MKRATDGVVAEGDVFLRAQPIDQILRRRRRQPSETSLLCCLPSTKEMRRISLLKLLAE